LPTAAGDSDRMLALFYTWLGPRCKATHLALFNRRVDDVDRELAPRRARLPRQARPRRRRRRDAAADAPPRRALTARYWYL